MTMLKDIRQAIKVNYLQPAFLICAGVLVITASAMSMVVKLAGIYLKKEPLPLKKPLNQLNNSELTPYKLVTKEEINNPDVIETLGTEDYLQWILENTSVPADSNTRFCTLFITYYALPDNVPHVPEECYIGGGFRRISSDVVTLKIITINQGISHEQQIAARYLVFGETTPQLWGSETTFPVLYTISVNGKYVGEREDARIILNRNLFSKSSYSSKVEWKFYNKSFGRLIYPNKQEALAASEKLLAVILPILEKEHWPSGLW